MDIRFRGTYVQLVTGQYVRMPLRTLVLQIALGLFICGYKSTAICTVLRMEKFVGMCKGFLPMPLNPIFSDFRKAWWY